MSGSPTLHADGGVARIVLRRPARANRLDGGDVALLAEHVAQVNAMSDVRVLRIEAEGRHFCSGFDIAAITPAGTAAFEAMVNAVEDARPVTLALIHGGVYGGATDLALACDFRIGTPDAQMFMPAARLGLHFYARGLERCVARLGLDNAKRLFLTGCTLDAAEMRAIGFLTQLVAAGDLPGAAGELTAQLSGMAPLALLGMKRHLNAIAARRVDADALQRDIATTLASADLQEGIAAWAEKRPPRFEGR